MLDTKQTNTRTFFMLGQRCIAKWKAVKEDNGMYRIYVAWEWEEQAEKGRFGFTESSLTYSAVNDMNIADAADYGRSIGGTGKEKEVFPELFIGVE